MSRLIYIFALVFLNFACTKSKTYKGPTTNNSKAQVSPSPQRIDIANASASQCPAGGMVYSVYTDANKNDALDSSDDLLSTQIICNGINGNNGSNGNNGHSTLISTTRVSVDLNACSSGSGLQVNVGLDENDDHVLDASEITNPQVLCDGANGAVGTAGPAGSNGFNMVFETAIATAIACPAGGSTVLMSLDTDFSSSVTPSDQNIQSMTLCNGQNGQNGQNAPATAYTPVEPILACGNTVSYKEVLLRLSNGQVLGSFSNNVGGDMTRLSFLPDGTFMNTDNSGCTFSLATSGDGSTRSISWFNQVQMTWAMSQ
jgi:hypothetical protein